MTDHAWDEGMGLLEANLRDRDLTPNMTAIRGATLRAALSHLTDEQWFNAVRRCIEVQDWFPTVRELLEHAAQAPSTRQPPAGLLPSDTRSIEERRAAFKRGFDEEFKPQLCANGIHLGCEHPQQAETVTASAAAGANEGRA